MAKGKYKLRSENRVDAEITNLIGHLREDLKDNANEIIRLRKELAKALLDSEIANNAKLVLEELHKTKIELDKSEKRATKLHGNVIEVLDSVFNPANKEFEPKMPIRIFELGIEFDVHSEHEKHTRTARRNMRSPAQLRRLYNAYKEHAPELLREDK
jgi:hypothetical protein